MRSCLQTIRNNNHLTCNLIYLKRRVLILANSVSGLCVKWRGGASCLTAWLLFLKPDPRVNSWAYRVSSHPFLAAFSPWNSENSCPVCSELLQAPHGCSPSPAGGASSFLFEVLLAKNIHELFPVCSRAHSSLILASKHDCLLCFPIHR